MSSQHKDAAEYATTGTGTGSGARYDSGSGGGTRSQGGAGTGETHPGVGSAWQSALGSQEPMTQTPHSRRPIKNLLTEGTTTTTGGGGGADSGGKFSPLVAGGGGAGSRDGGRVVDEPYGVSVSGDGSDSSGQDVRRFGEETETATTTEGKKLPPNFFLDEELESEKHPFPIEPSDLIFRARQVLAEGVYRWPDLSDDFEFSAPFIGPLGREEFRSTLATLALDEAFPDMEPRYHHFRVDPFRPNRVWVTLQPRCTHTGTFKGKLPFGIKPTGKVIEEPPQTCSVSFNAAGQVSGYTMGYVMDRRVGNTGGLGGAFGLMFGLGAPLPAPEGHPWSPSLQLKLVNSGNWWLQGVAYMYDRVASRILPTSWLTKRARNNM